MNKNISFSPLFDNSNSNQIIIYRILLGNFF
nr:MAG TPA: hypothetical protein [Caudoviricetes sp.]